jgi:hypothetical protein
MYSAIKTTTFSLIVLVLLLVSCSNEKKESPTHSKLEIKDDFHLLSTETKEYLNNIKFPDNILVLIRTVDEIELSQIGSYASSKMEEEDWWKEVNPQGLYQRWIKQNKPWSKGIYIVVSQEPHLIQIRYGERIRLEAFRAGLAVGHKYSDMQTSFATKTIDEGVINTVQQLSKEMPTALQIPKYLRYTKFLVAVTFSEFEELATPANKIYNSWILKPYFKLIVLCGGLHSRWLFIALNLVLFFILDYAVIAMFTFLFLRKKEKTVKLRWKKYISLIIATLFSVPFFGATILLSGARVEDVLAVQQIGIVIPENIRFGMKWFMNVTGFWFAFLITMINYINLLIDDPLKKPVAIYHFGSPDTLTSYVGRMSSNQPTFYNKWSYAKIGEHKYVVQYDEYVYRPSFALFVFLLFMPKAIGLVALLKQIFDLITLIPSFFKPKEASEENT